jgi:hypothetical protein
MKRESFTLIVLLVEIVAISFLHVAKKDQPTPANHPPAMVQQQPAGTSYQWNNNFTLIRLK